MRSALSTLSTAIVLALVTTTALADSLRSDRYFVKIDVQRLGATSNQYNVQVFDDSRSHVTDLKVVTKGDAAEETESVVNGTRYKARVEPHGEAYLFHFTADDGAEGSDVMHGGFTSAAPSKPAPAPTPLRAGRDVKEPAVIRRTEALYTEEAKAASAVGSVVLELLIDKSGFVKQAAVLRPMGYGLTESAVEAAKQWIFAPSMQGRAPVEVVQEVTIEFKP
jgi:TonB family protein